MKSIREIYNIGYGPSSSHTMGPSRAAGLFLEKNPGAEKFRVTLYGSLALTGKGHGTDSAILKVIDRPDAVEIVWKPDISLPRHPNGMLFEAFVQGNTVDSWEVYSVGGGALWDELGTFDDGNLYPETSMAEVMKWCLDEGCTFVDYVEKYEGSEIFTYLEEVWKQMQETVEKGLVTEGVLPGALKLARKASSYNIKALQSSGSSRPMGSFSCLGRKCRWWPGGNCSYLWGFRSFAGFDVFHEIRSGDAGLPDYPGIGNCRVDR